MKRVIDRYLRELGGAVEGLRAQNEKSESEVSRFRKSGKPITPTASGASACHSSSNLITGFTSIDQSSQLHQPAVSLCCFYGKTYTTTPFFFLHLQFLQPERWHDVRRTALVRA